jgi:anti-sigma B factor antagonist
MLTIDCSEQKDLCIISLNGELIFNEMEDADKIIMEKMAMKPKVMAMNCKKLHSLDSSGLGLFIKFSKEAKKSGIRLVFLDITDHISTLFDVSKLESIFEIMSDEEFKKTFPL